MTTKPKHRILTFRETCDELRVSGPTLRAFIRRGRLRVARIGKQIRVRREDLNALLSGTEASA